MAIAGALGLGACDSGGEAGPAATGGTAVPSTTFTVGGTVSGLAGTGLVLQNEGGDDLTITANGSFTFATSIADGTAYAVTVKIPPSSPSQTCGVASGTGTLSGSDVTGVTITCSTQAFPIGGTVSGLGGSGLVLRNNGGDDLTVTANGTFTFPTPVLSGSSYTATVKTQPTSLNQTCTVSNETGTVGTTSVTDIAVTCSTTTYTVGGTLTGLSSGSVSLQNNGGDNLTLTGDGSFVFGTALTDGSGYNVTVSSQPSGEATLNCYVSNGSGTLAGSAVSSVAVLCTAGVAPLYPTNGINWNQYVKNDGGTVFTGTDTACDGTETGGYSACLHGGEMRVVPVSGQTSCSGLSATDALGVFDWSCYLSGGTARMASRGLKAGKKLSDLLDWTNSPPTWKSDSVTVTKSGVTIATTPASTWWSNGITDNPPSSSLATKGQLYLFTANQNRLYTMDADEVAVVTQPGLTIQGNQTNGKVISSAAGKFLWIEATVDATGDDHGISLGGTDGSTVDFSVMRGVSVRNTNGDGPLSAETRATPRANVAGAPLNVRADSRNGEVFITWTAVSGATSYTIYWETSPGVTTGSSNTIAVPSGVSATHSGLTNGTSYFYIVTATVSSVEGAASAEAMATPRAAVTFSPTEISSQSQDSQIFIRWGVMANDGYRLYWNTTGSVTKSDTMIEIGKNNSSYTHTSLTNDSVTYYYAVASIGPENHGVVINRTRNSRFEDIKAFSNLGNGIDHVNSASENPKNANNRFADLYVANNGGWGFVGAWATGFQTLRNVTAVNNGVGGFSIAQGSQNFSVVNLTAANNGGDGLSLNLVPTMLLINITTANNGAIGIHTNRDDRHTFLNALTLNNTQYGLFIGQNGGTNHTFLNLASAHNSTDGIRDTRTLGNSSYFSGLVKLGGNTTDCNLPDNASWTEKGLDPSCNKNAQADAAVTTGVTAASTPAGKIASPGDTANQSDSDGLSAYDSITDWTTFDNLYRHWGKEAAAAFPDSGNQGRCISGENCRIWDWSLASGDTVAKDALALPTGDDFVLQTWTTSIVSCSTIPGAIFSTLKVCSKPGLFTQSTCEATNLSWTDQFNASGDDGDWTTDKCVSRFLKHAVEIMGDGIGNDNNLCESNETCLFTPNIGAYQGHGNLISAGLFTDGALTGITLLKHESNGR